MGYETWSNHMIAMQFTDGNHAAVYLLRGLNPTLLRKLKLKKKDVAAYLNSEDHDPEALYDQLGVSDYDVCTACGLCFEYEGDARFDVPHGYLGMSFSSMKDAETKRKFITRVNKLIEKYSKQVSNVSEVSFSYTC